MSEKEPTIVRIQKPDRTDYTMISNDLLQNKAMSYESRGLLCYLLSHPNDWEIRVKDLQQQCGKAKVYRILNDLIDYQYVQRVAIRNEQNQFIEWIYTASEERYPKKRDDANPEPLTENPELANPQVGNGDTYKGISSTKEELNKETTFASPDGNAAGDKSDWLPMSLAMRWFEAKDAMLEFPDAPFYHDITRVNDYLNGLVNDGTLTPDMDSQQVFAIVKSALIAPPDDKEQLVIIDHDKEQRYEHKRTLKCSLCGTGYVYQYGGDFLDAYDDTGWIWSDANEMICIDCAEKLEDEKQDEPDDTPPASAPAPKPKKERKPNPWYDAIKETAGVEGFKNGNVQNVLLAKGKKAYAKYDLETPLTDPEQIHTFWAWYQTECKDCDLVSPAAWQDWVMRWQTAGCPDVREPQAKPWGGLAPVTPDYGTD